MLSVTIQSIMLSGIMLSVFMLNVVVLNVVAPFKVDTNEDVKFCFLR